jgi:hypothetical protein
MALTTGDLAQLKAAYENMNVYDKNVAPIAVNATAPVSLEDMSIYGNVAPNNASGLQTIDIAKIPEAQSVTQSNGLDYLLNQEGGQNQNLTVEEYNKAIANQNTEPTNNFLTRAFSNVMDNRYVQGARNLGSMITDPLMGGIGYLAKKVDKFSSLPYVDQQFIKENMAYKNPDSGLPQDLFGINTRSMFGNYAEFVGKESEKLDAAVEKATDKYEALGYTPAQIAKQLSGLLKRQSFYGDKNLDYNKKKQAFDKTIEIKEIERENRRIEVREAAERKQAEQQALNQAYAAQSQAKRNQIQQSTGGQYDRAGSKAEYNRDPTGYSGSFKKGGRTGYGTGGIVTL